MGWDCFISHASEDKQTVALPLKTALEALGVSVWLDMEQIDIGQGLRRRIDHGLAHCEYTLVIEDGQRAETRTPVSVLRPICCTRYHI